MSGPISCQMPNCDGVLDPKNGVSLQVGCHMYATCYPCSKCGRIHSPSGDLMFGRQGHSPYYRDGVFENVLEPVEFTPGEAYITGSWIYIFPDNYPEAETIEIEPGTTIIFVSMDEETFYFRGEDGNSYPLHRGDVNFLEKVESIN